MLAGAKTAEAPRRAASAALREARKRRHVGRHLTREGALPVALTPLHGEQRETACFAALQIRVPAAHEACHLGMQHRTLAVGERDDFVARLPRKVLLMLQDLNGVSPLAVPHPQRAALALPGKSCPSSAEASQYDETATVRPTLSETPEPGAAYNHMGQPFQAGCGIPLLAAFMGARGQCVTSTQE
eukprot:351167-Prymnesium_polylepis.1